VNVGSVPNVFDPLPGSPVTVAYNRGGDYRVALIASDESAIRKFSTVLFKVLLNGTHATIKHPAKLGGRVLDTETRGALLSLENNSVRFETEEGAVVIELDSVIEFSKEDRGLTSDTEAIISVDHMENREAMTTFAAIKSSRKLGLLGRYIRKEYRKLRESLSALSLSETETEVLTAIYSVGDQDLSLVSMLDVDGSEAKRILHSLHEDGLIESGNHGPILTPKGQVVVNQYLERVNE
jgi:helix-turn-helix protein